MKVRIVNKKGKVLKRIFDAANNLTKLTDGDCSWLNNNLHNAYGGIDARNMMTEGKLMWCDEYDNLLTVFKHKFVKWNKDRWIEVDDINIDCLYYEVVEVVIICNLENVTTANSSLQSAINDFHASFGNVLKVFAELLNRNIEKK